MKFIKGKVYLVICGAKLEITGVPKGKSGIEKPKRVIIYRLIFKIQMNPKINIANENDIIVISNANIASGLD
ncbi:MAG: hypothetical protein RBT65_03270 [Methanolobus sp.]|nr:hypothetical protein [Methanolobus sp.]